MDEAVSSLDTESEVNVRRAIKEISAGRTTLIVAHRPSTIRSADRVIMLANGKVEESGTFDELVTAKGSFGRLMAAQITAP